MSLLIHSPVSYVIYPSVYSWAQLSFVHLSVPHAITATFSLVFTCFTALVTYRYNDKFSYLGKTWRRAATLPYQEEPVEVDIWLGCSMDAPQFSRHVQLRGYPGEDLGQIGKIMALC